MLKNFDNPGFRSNLTALTCLTAEQLNHAYCLSSAVFIYAPESANPLETCKLGLDLKDHEWVVSEDGGAPSPELKRLEAVANAALAAEDDPYPAFTEEVNKIVAERLAENLVTDLVTSTL